MTESTKTERAEAKKTVDLRIAGVLILETFLPQLRELIEMKCMHAARDAGMAEPFERMIEQIERAGVMLNAERASIESANAAFLETYGSAESQ
jgi:hypothetical protein